MSGCPTVPFQNASESYKKSPKDHNILNILGYQSYYCISPIRYIYIYNIIYIYIISPILSQIGIFLPQELKNGTCILAGAWGRQISQIVDSSPKQTGV